MSSRWGRADARQFDDALSGGPATDDIAVLVRTAERLRDSADAELRPAFRAELRERLLLEASTVLAPPGVDHGPASAPARPRPLRRRLAAVVAVLVAAVGTVGVVASSASAVPGDMLYPVKRGVESVELTLHRDDTSRGEFRLSLATERLEEASALARRDSASSHTSLVKALDDFTEQAVAGSSALFDDFASRGDESSIELVASFATASGTRLSDLSDLLPGSADTAFRTASATVDDLVEQASAVCGQCVVADIGALVRAVESRSPVRATRGSADHDERASADDAGSAGGSLTDTPADERPPHAPTPVVPSGQPPALPAPGTTPAPEPPASPAPRPAPTKAPSLADVTDPLLGALLGDDNQIGLVPGLLGGLLGNGR